MNTLATSVVSLSLVHHLHWYNPRPTKIGYAGCPQKPTKRRQPALGRPAGSPKAPTPPTAAEAAAAKQAYVQVQRKDRAVQKGSYGLSSSRRHDRICDMDLPERNRALEHQRQLRNWPLIKAVRRVCAASKEPTALGKCRQQQRYKPVLKCIGVTQ